MFQRETNLFIFLLLVITATQSLFYSQFLFWPITPIICCSQWNYHFSPLDLPLLETVNSLRIAYLPPGLLPTFSPLEYKLTHYIIHLLKDQPLLLTTLWNSVDTRCVSSTLYTVASYTRLLNTCSWTLNNLMFDSFLSHSVVKKHPPNTDHCVFLHESLTQDTFFFCSY